MPDWNKILIKEAKPITKELEKFPETKAITFFGSIGAGYAINFLT